jgi:hypothetical protein
MNTEKADLSGERDGSTTHSRGSRRLLILFGLPWVLLLAASLLAAAISLIAQFFRG